MVLRQEFLGIPVLQCERCLSRVVKEVPKRVFVQKYSGSKCSRLWGMSIVGGTWG